MTSAIDVWWIRHGESVRNAGERTFDTYNAPMTALGHEQARRAALAIQGRPDLVVHSSFMRARQTAAPFLERFAGVTNEEWDVHEYNFLCDVRTRDTTRMEREPWVREYWERCDPAHVHGTGAESFQGFIERVDRAIEKLRARRESWVVICSHHHFMFGVVFRLQNLGLKPDAGMMRAYCGLIQSQDIPNGGLVRTVLDRAGNAARVSPCVPVGEPWIR
ncbi:MAG TPA: histidine phosphatase family protein [Phycisphaerales bacterium]|nr:histidine phosphatase family protein [Phycisphaerales bacterium]